MTWIVDGGKFPRTTFTGARWNEKGYAVQIRNKDIVICPKMTVMVWYAIFSDMRLYDCE